jgi:hypothetical protein
MDAGSRVLVSGAMLVEVETVLQTQVFMLHLIIYLPVQDMLHGYRIKVKVEWWILDTCVSSTIVLIPHYCTNTILADICPVRPAKSNQLL